MPYRRREIADHKKRYLAAIIMSLRFPSEEIMPLVQKLCTPQHIVITTHHKPDGDAIGSALGLYNYLIQKKHRVDVIVPSDFPSFLKWMPGLDAVTNFEKDEAKAIEKVTNASLIFCLDFNKINRLEGLEPFIQKARAVKVLIDHHLEPDSFCTHTFSYPDSCATSELIYDFICALGDKHLLNKEISECLYAGIMTDTGSFRFASTRPATLRIAADLVEAGANHTQIHEAVYDDFSEDRLRLLGYCITHKLQIFHEYNSALITLSQKELERFNYQPGDTEGIVNVPLGIKGIRMAAFFMESGRFVKISMRSKNDVSVKDIAQKYFEGGGHKNAAGGRSSLTLADTEKKFISILPFYREMLTK